MKSTDIKIPEQIMHCPFCGTAPFVNKSDASLKIVCPDCLVSIVAVDLETAAARWNKRAPSREQVLNTGAILRKVWDVAHEDEKIEALKSRIELCRGLLQEMWEDSQEELRQNMERMGLDPAFLLASQGEGAVIIEHKNI